MRQFLKGEPVKIKAHHAESGRGLDYEAQTVVADEDGTAGGWDVYDGRTATGESISFYGFSVARTLSE